MKFTVRKALTFRASSIGDSLMAKYLLENIHAAYPDATCAILVASKSGMIRDLLAAYTWIEVIEANKNHPKDVFNAFKKLYPSDLTVTQYSGRGRFGTGSKLFARALTRSGRMVGFTDTWPFNHFLYDHLIPFDSRRALRLHECDALRSLGIEPTISRITLEALPGNPILEKLHLQERNYIVANLFSGSLRRGLSLAHQIRIVQVLRERFGMSKKIILTGGPSDESLVSKIKDAAPELVVAPCLSMQETITLVSKSAGVVSLDTGVAHIAAQTGTPLVVLRTCWGYNWWNKDQYPSDSIRVLSHDELCVKGHINKDFPDCLDEITEKEILQSTGAVFIGM